MKRVIITTDSSSDITCSSALPDVDIIPMHITLSGRDYRDGIDIRPTELLKRCSETGEIPKTAAVSPQTYSNIFERYTSSGCEVVHVALSSKISSAYRNAQLAAEGNPDVYVVDGLNLSAGLALLVLDACDMRNRGATASEISEILMQKRNRVNTSFVLDNLDFMQKGGRCSSVAKGVSSVFSVKPSVEVVGGKLMAGKRFLGNTSQVRKKYAQACLFSAQHEPYRCLINHSCPEQEAKDFAESIEKSGAFQQILLNRAGCCISSHCGPGCIGMIFYNT